MIPTSNQFFIKSTNQMLRETFQPFPAAFFTFTLLVRMFSLFQILTFTKICASNLHSIPIFTSTVGSLKPNNVVWYSWKHADENLITQKCSNNSIIIIKKNPFKQQWHGVLMNVSIRMLLRFSVRHTSGEVCRELLNAVSHFCWFSSWKWKGYIC